MWPPIFLFNFFIGSSNLYFLFMECGHTLCSSYYDLFIYIFYFIFNMPLYSICFFYYYFYCVPFPKTLGTLLILSLIIKIIYKKLFFRTNSGSSLMYTPLPIVWRSQKKSRFLISVGHFFYILSSWVIYWHLTFLRSLFFYFIDR